MEVKKCTIPPKIKSKWKYNTYFKDPCKNRSDELHQQMILMGMIVEMMHPDYFHTLASIHKLVINEYLKEYN